MDITSKEFKRLVKEIARRNETDPDIVRNIIISEFECVRAHMRRADSYNDHFPYIKLPYLFSFKVLPRRRRFYVDKAKKLIEYVQAQSGEPGS